MLPSFRRDSRLKLVAGCDPRSEARELFAREFGANTYQNVAELCSDPGVELVYIASPHEFHAEHAFLAARSRKHILVEKPMAITVEDCSRMIDAALKAGVHLIVGHCHSFDAPIARTREIIRSGRVGRLRMIHALNYTDFLYRARRSEELDTARGGGVVYSQASHQVDIARLLAGGEIVGVRAATGSWDARRPTEGAYSAILTFADGAFASLTYSGYAHFDSDELTGWIGELGYPKDPEFHGAARTGLLGKSAAEESVMKNRRAYGGPDYDASMSHRSAPHHQHFGFLVASCDRADLRPMPSGIMVYGDTERNLEPVPPPVVPRAEVMDEVVLAVREGRPPLHSGEWARATVEVCNAILESARVGRDIEPKYQVKLDG